MRLRPATTLIALTALLTVTTGCSEQVAGSPSAGAAPTSNPAEPPANTPKTGMPNAKIGTKKNTAGLQTCGVLKAADVESATGGKTSTDGGCILAVSTPYLMVTQMVTVADIAMEGEKKQLEIGGNTAWQASTATPDCQVIVVLTDDPAAIMNAFSVSVTGIEEIDACGMALKLATAGFERIPNG